jgi:MFS family permease
MNDVGSGPKKRPGKLFYGWWIVISGFAIQAVNGGLLFHGFTVYFLPLQSEFGWSRALVATGFSLTRAESALVGPVEGWAIDHFGPRIIVTVGIVLFGAGFVVFSAINSVPHYFLAFLLLSLGSSLGGFLPISAAITNWFAQRRALALGIAMTGMGLGGLLVPALAWSVTTHGWRTTALASGVLIWLIGIPAALLLRHKPEPYGYLPDGAKPAHFMKDAAVPIQRRQPEVAAPATDDFSVKDALRTPAFWLISGGHASALLVVSAVSLHQVPHMVQRLSMSLGSAAMVVAFLMAMTIVGQLGGGFVGDKVNKKALLVACMLGHTAGLLSLAYATSPLHLVLYAVLHGLAWGARGPLMQSLRADYFGRSSFATIMGFSSVIVTIAMIIAPIFAGWLADVQGGSYTMPFTILAILTGLGSLFFYFANKPVRKPMSSVSAPAVTVAPRPPEERAEAGLPAREDARP